MIRLFALTALLALQISCTTMSAKTTAHSAMRTVAADDGDVLNYKDVVDMTSEKGKPTFLTYMKSTIKPALDRIAQNGYKVGNESVTRQALQHVSKKVYGKALRGAGGEEELYKLANILAARPGKVTLYDLDDIIEDEDYKNPNTHYDQYSLSTFFGLASGGGVAVKFFENNYAYNVHYGYKPSDMQTGRSFGKSPLIEDGKPRGADDASDKQYLTDVQKYYENTEDLSPFFRTLLQALTVTDTSGYRDLSPQGQSVLTDFLAVYIAEQDRNLMDNHIKIHWDAALLEVTLLSAFHAGQDYLKLFFFNPNYGSYGRTVFTNRVLKQATGCDERTKEKDAQFLDYWQFSRSEDPKNCSRSGINITRKEFRKLGGMITTYFRSGKNAYMIDNIERHFSGIQKGGNIFEELSRYLINDKTPKTLGKKGYDIADDFTKFLVKVREEAPRITKYIENNI